MKKKVVLPVLLTGLLVWGSVPAEPIMANSASLDKINKEIEQIRKNQQAKKQNLQSIKNEINSLKNQQANLNDELMAIDLRRNETQRKIDKLDKDIKVTTEKAVEAQAELDEATDRVKKRDALLKTRVKAMYEGGTVTYLDVLLGSSDFGDFLTRLQGLQMIVEQDTRILEDNIRDKETIEAKKKEVDKQLASLNDMIEQQEALKADLDKQYERSKQVKAALAEKETHLHEIQEEEEQELLAMAQQEAAKVAERSKLQAVSDYKGGKMFLPLPPGSFYISSGFGARPDPFTGKQVGHNGLDMAAPKGTNIYAAADGIVIVAGYVNGFGNCVMIKHSEEITTLYGHIREGGIQVSVGQSVKAGDKIAEVGSTGRSTGNHLHFTVYKNNIAVDPSPYIR
ncbi:murein hydrolase activator EnvC family protein [Brevibacillus sp. B_LB10_24]|uniref:murein hydrolase activator EnvC family protein n=1 Tax=Brevibacillus sp. B_LB10_24 TaxID=3380645 RepID=UPI0038B8FE27